MKARATTFPRYWLKRSGGVPVRWMVKGGEGRAVSAAGAVQVNVARRKMGRAFRMFVSSMPVSSILQVSRSMVPFDPLLRSPHLQTIAAHFWKRPDVAADFPVERRLYRTEPDVQVLVCSQRPRQEARGEIFIDRKIVV